MSDQNQDPDLSFEFIFKHFPVSIWWMDRNHIYRGCNLENCRIAGVNSPDEFIGKNVFDIEKNLNLPQSRSQAVYDLDEYIMQTGVPQKNIHNAVLQTNEGALHQVSLRQPIFNKDGQVIGLIGIGISNAELGDQPKLVAP